MSNRFYSTEKVPEPSRDQHILVDEEILETIIRNAEIENDDTVLEIGGGPGNLTEKIAQYAHKVLVFEKDATYVEMLKEKFRAGNVTVGEGNILHMKLPAFNKIVSNIPYSISEPLFLRLIKEKRDLDSSTIVLPRDFVKRMVAPVFSPLFGMMSALFTAFYHVEIITQIPPEAFSPPPRVTSYCVKIRQKLQVPSKKTRVEYLIQRLFLYDEKNVKNIFLETLWNHGLELTGKTVTKREARDLIHTIFGEEFHSFSHKKVAHLSNEHIKKVVSQLMCWDVYETYGIT